METKKNKNLKFLMNFEFISRRETIPKIKFLSGSHMNPNNNLQN